MPRHVPEWHPEPRPYPVRMDRILAVGCLLWALALAATLLVPGLHQGERDWWPTAAATALALGALGWVLVRRGVGAAR